MRSPGMGRAAAAVGIVALLLLAFELARPRDYVLGTNGAGSQGPVVQVAQGQSLCFPGMRVPAGTARLRLRSGPGSAALHFPVVAAAAEQCVTVPAAAMLHGRPGVESDDPPPTLDGAPLDARIEVVFLPREGARRSLASSLPEIARRAALFRPDWAGGWLYWLLLLGIWPGLAAAGLWVLLRPPSRRPALAVGAIAFGLSASWAMLSPAFSTPDETEHFAIAQTIAERGRTSELHPPGTRPAFSSAQRVAWEHLDLAGFLGQREGRPPWDPASEAAWKAADADAGARPPRDDGGGPQVGSAYQPLYYAALAPAYAAGGSAFASLTAMRLVSALLFGLVAAFTVLALLELGAPRWAACGGGLLVAFQPMASFLGGAVNNDAAVNAAAAGLLLLLIRALRRGPSPRLAGAIGAAVVLAVYAKGSGVFLVPAALLALAALARAHTGARHLVAGAVAAAVVCGGLALALDHSAWPLAPARVAADSRAFPTSPGPEVQTDQALRHPVAYASHLWQLALPPLPGMEDLRPPDFPRPGYTIYVKRAWGAFGFASILFPGWVYAVIALAMAGVLALAVRAALRERAALRARAWPAAVLALAGLSVVLGAEAVWFSPEQRSTLGSYGRYAFPALLPAAVLVVFASFGLGRRWAPAILGGLVTAMIALQLAAVWLNVSALYA